MNRPLSSLAAEFHVEKNILNFKSTFLTESAPLATQIFHDKGIAWLSILLFLLFSFSTERKEWREKRNSRRKQIQLRNFLPKSKDDDAHCGTKKKRRWRQRHRRWRRRRQRLLVKIVTKNTKLSRIIFMFLFVYFSIFFIKIEMRAFHITERGAVGWWISHIHIHIVCTAFTSVQSFRIIHT